jgi:undecaprenyl-diphosphatase
LGKGLVLNGATGYLRIEEPGWPTDDYTYAVWLLPRAIGNWQSILEIQTSSSRGLELAIAPGGRLEVWSSGALRLRHGPSLTPGMWTHVALTRAGTLMTLFVNGVAQRAGRDRAVFDFGRCPALVGVDADLGCAGQLTGFFGGLLDELRVYDCALPAAGIRSIMYAPVDPSSRAWDRPAAEVEKNGPKSPSMSSTPPRFDVWVAAQLAAWLTRSPAFDRFIAQGVGYGVLGGLGYAAVVFLLWMQGAQPGQRDLRRQTVTLALGSLVAALVTLLEARIVSWPPPSAHPEVAGLYPADFPVNLNENSFPSQSTALYSAIATGIGAISRTLAVWSWMGVVVLVALPRMYVGGHYVSEVLGGIVAGLGGYWLVVLLLGRTVVPRCENIFELGWRDWRRRLAEVLVFLWILQVALEFDHVVWITSALASLWG